jgi:hypothetical protein
MGIRNPEDRVGVAIKISFIVGESIKTLQFCQTSNIKLRL